MRKPLKSKAGQRNQITVSRSYESPTGGWNARDALAAMEPKYAVTLKNWFPTPTDCVLRGGFTAHSTGVVGYTKTLAVYNALNGTSKLFAASDTQIYDASVPGVATSQALTVTNGKYQFTNFGDGSANYLVMVNGTDSPKYHNGTTWIQITGVSSPALTGVTLASLVNVCVYQGRLFFLENNSLSFWYLAAGAAGGALTRFPLDAFAPRGGYIMWAAVWTFDGGLGMDDNIVFMTSEGEAIIYRGTNPSSAASWVRVGTFFLSKPLGRKSYVNYSGDLIALTQTGAFPLSAALQSAQENKRIGITDIIDLEFNSVAGLHENKYGWQAVVLPLKSALIINIPISETTGQKQFVMNTITKAWCEFDAWNATCLAVYKNELYFGGNTIVSKGWNGVSDGGMDIVGVGRTAFNYFDDNSQQKKVNMFRPTLRVNGSLNFLSGFDVDYQNTEIVGSSSYSSTGTATWNSSTWNSAVWVFGLEIIRKWTSPSNNVGYCVSGKIKVNTSTLTIRWTSCDYVYETGGIL